MRLASRWLGLAVIGVSLVGSAGTAQASTCIWSQVNIRSGPSTGYGIIGSLRYGQYCAVSYVSGDWARIYSPINGWVWKYALRIGSGSTTTSSGSNFTWPVSGRINTPFYEMRSYGWHGAIDIGAGYWTWVAPARSGTVTFRGWSGGYGNLVIVGHESGFSTYYAHNIAFGSWGWVNRGSTISYIGSTGNSTGPHCHFEIRQWGVKRYIPGWYGNWVTKGSGVPWNYGL